MNSANVSQFYRTVIDDVINNVRETFLDEGVDEQVLIELKQVWETKIALSKALPNENESRDSEGNSSTSAIESTAKTNSNRVSVVSSAAAAAANTAGSSATANAISASANVAVTSTAAVTTAPTVQYHYTHPTGQSGDAPKTVTITLPSQSAAPGQKPVTITLPAHLVQNPQGGGIIMSTSAATAAQALPAGIAAGLLQSQLTRVISQDGTVSYQALTAEQLAKQGYMVSVAPRPATQMTAVTTASTASSSTGKVHPGGDPLNSDDDVSDEDPAELFDTDNVIVCQYDKITRSRNKWKFHLKDGIMNLQGKDYIFQKAIGDAEW
ncbi:hypothetical protein CHUAL_004412 [Chamberlinius hualienensis]